jgi:hypothetical protein
MKINLDFENKFHSFGTIQNGISVSSVRNMRLVVENIEEGSFLQELEESGLARILRVPWIPVEIYAFICETVDGMHLPINKIPDTCHINI